MSQTKNPTAAIIVIGDEILSGRTKDKNIGWLAENLSAQGIQLVEARVIADQRQAIIDTVQILSATYDLIFTSGGIGPTHDDITTEAVATAFNVPVIRHPEAERRLLAHYSNTDLEFNMARQKMADIPETATLIDNPISAAPGFIIGNVHVLPGVPTILQAMFEGLRNSLRTSRKNRRKREGKPSSRQLLSNLINKRKNLYSRSLDMRKAGKGFSS